MQFIRRHDFPPHTRIALVKLAWLTHGISGKMPHLAQEYHLSRTLLSQLLWAANRQWETLCSDQQPHVQDAQLPFEPCILLWRLEGKGSLPSRSSIVKYVQSQPNAVG
jgi:hypothetical protein